MFYLSSKNICDTSAIVCAREVGVEFKGTAKRLLSCKIICQLNLYAAYVVVQERCIRHEVGGLAVVLNCHEITEAEVGGVGRRSRHFELSKATLGS